VSAEQIEKRVGVKPNSSFRVPAAVVIALVLLAHALWLLPLPLAWQGAGAELLLALPGALLAVLLFHAERDPLTLAFLALCGGIALQTPLLLALYALPGQLPWLLALLPCDALSLALGWLLCRKLRTAESTPALRWSFPYPLLGIMLIAAALRLPFLGGAEFQGDETRAMFMALNAVNGMDTGLLLHSKGPVEVLLPMGLLALVGNVNEWMARLPFALAGVGAPLGAYLLARQMFLVEGRPADHGRLIGLIAAMIIALDGFLIAFSRIVQYQNVLMLMAIGALWCCWRFYQGVTRPQPYLISAAALAAIGLLAHYDGLFILPPLAWLLVAGGRRRGWRAAQWAGGLAAPLAVGTTFVASFYVPFVLNEQFRTTLAYLQTRTGQGAGAIPLFNNLIEYYGRATFYNTTFQIDLLAAVLAVGLIIWLCSYGRPRALGWGLSGLLLAGCTLLLVAPARFVLPGGGNWALLAFGLPLAGLALSPATPAQLRLLLIWFAPPFIAESFLFAKPVTHFYAMDIAAALLIALALARLLIWLHARGQVHMRVLLAICGALLLGLSIPYLYIVFVRQAPEYRLVFPTARPAIYRAAYQDQLPAKSGYFGFPHRAGWKVIGELYRQGILQGDFDSNEDFLITHWYTRKASNCDASPTYYFLARTPIDAGKVPLDRIKKQYHLFGSVLVEGVPKIDIYSRQPAAQPPRSFELEDYSGAFERQPLINYSPQSAVLDLLPGHPAGVRWQNGISLAGDELDHQRFVPGQDAKLVFQWQAAAPLDRRYDVSVDIMDSSGKTVASIGPLCNYTPFERWHVHTVNKTSILWGVNKDLRPGTYSLRVGLRATQARSVLSLADGSTSLEVASLVVTHR
jgi:hypothetical protein